MIHYIKGHWHESLTGGLVISNNVGYKIKTVGPHQTGDSVEFFVTPLVKVNGEVSLYGFTLEEEQILFNELIKIQGIGGSLAINIISGIGYESLVNAVKTKDREPFKKVKGMGAKTIDRIFANLNLDSLAIETSYNDVEGQSIKALISLGFKGREASELIKSLDSLNLTSVEEYVVQALQKKGKSFNV